MLNKLPKHKCGLYLDHNSHKDSYMTLEDYCHGYEWDELGFVSEEDFKLCIDLDEVWSLQWYPDTPIGSYTVRASSLSFIEHFLKENKFI